MSFWCHGICQSTLIVKIRTNGWAIQAPDWISLTVRRFALKQLAGKWPCCEVDLKLVHHASIFSCLSSSPPNPSPGSPIHRVITTEAPALLTVLCFTVWVSSSSSGEPTLWNFSSAQKQQFMKSRRGALKKEWKSLPKKKKLLRMSILQGLLIVHRNFLIEKRSLRSLSGLGTSSLRSTASESESLASCCVVTGRVTTSS